MKRSIGGIWKFQIPLEASRNKDQSVEAGREYVAAYVTYVHYVEGVHDAVVATDAHHAGHDSDYGHAH